jgi:hypothetical protein
MRDVKEISKLELLFRLAAQLDVDKNDLRRHTDFVNQKIYDLLVRGEAVARANLKNPQTRHWEQAMSIFNLLL